MTVLVSVVVPTYQRHDLLRRCMTALLTQDFVPAAYEIIIADDAASAETRCMVTSWAERVKSTCTAMPALRPCYMRAWPRRRP